MKTRIRIPREKETSRAPQPQATQMMPHVQSRNDALQRLIDKSARVQSMQVYQAMTDAAQLKPDRYFPDAGRYPHIHYHSGGVTFSWNSSRHSKLKSGESWNTITIQRVIDELRESKYMDPDHKSLLIARLQRHLGGSD